MSKPVKRYKLETIYKQLVSHYLVGDDKEGDYVPYTDYSSRVAELGSQVAMLREALEEIRRLNFSSAAHNGAGYYARQVAEAALAATESTAAEYRKRIEVEALERVAMCLQAEIDSGYDEQNDFNDGATFALSKARNAIRAMKG